VDNVSAQVGLDPPEGVADGDDPSAKDTLRIKSFCLEDLSGGSKSEEEHEAETQLGKKMILGV
jgi:hypothetical protein